MWWCVFFDGEFCWLVELIGTPNLAFIQKFTQEQDELIRALLGNHYASILLSTGM